MNGTSVTCGGSSERSRGQAMIYTDEQLTKATDAVVAELTDESVTLAVVQREGRPAVVADADHLAQLLAGPGGGDLEETLAAARTREWDVTVDFVVGRVVMGGRWASLVRSGIQVPGPDLTPRSLRRFRCDLRQHIVWRDSGGIGTSCDTRLDDGTPCLGTLEAF